MLVGVVLLKRRVMLSHAAVGSGAAPASPSGSRLLAVHLLAPAGRIPRRVRGPAVQEQDFSGLG